MEVGPLELNPPMIPDAIILASAESASQQAAMRIYRPDWNSRPSLAYREL
jgi:hypothetical protein